MCFFVSFRVGKISHRKKSDVKHRELLCIYEFTHKSAAQQVQEYSLSTFICNHLQIVFLTRSFPRPCLMSHKTRFLLFFHPSCRCFHVFAIDEWIKNRRIHMKIFFVCKHFTYVSVIFCLFLGGEETWILEKIHKKWATHAKWTKIVGFSGARFSPFGPVILWRWKKNAALLGNRKNTFSMVHHRSQLVLVFFSARLDFNEFHSSNKNV